jgi:hypothetical protein
VTDCPARDCDGRALITYEAHRFRSPSVRLIAGIACDREGCKYYASAETVAADLGRDDPRLTVPRRRTERAPRQPQLLAEGGGARA